MQRNELVRVHVHTLHARKIFRACAMLCSMRQVIFDPRFWSGVAVTEQANACWVWLGLRDRDGYGRYGRSGSAHRYAYEASVGPIQDDLTIDHLCGTRACCNPYHLEAVTIAENVQRAAERRRGDIVLVAYSSADFERLVNPQENCGNGHPRTADNVRPRNDGGRDCRTCDREKKRRLKAARRGAAAQQTAAAQHGEEVLSRG